MDGALSRGGNIGEPADQAFSNFAGTPAGVLALHVQKEGLYLEREFIGISIGAPAPIGQPFDSAILVTIEDLVAGLAGDPELPAKFRHGFAG